MSVNNFDVNRILLELDSELINAHDELESEVRLDNEQEIRDAVKYSQREALWINRLHSGLSIHIMVGTIRIIGIIQHVCDEAIVIVSENSICVIPPTSVTAVLSIPTKSTPRTHAEHRCWRAILSQVHDVKVIQRNAFHVGTVESINRDAFDFTEHSERVTLPWNHIDFVEIPL